MGTRWNNGAVENKFLVFFLFCYLGYFIHLTDQETYYVQTVRERILDRGYPAEEHGVHTEDGYILSVQRIPSVGPPVLLLHGLADSSATWVMDEPSHSLAHILHDEGFDVWLGNVRGHTTRDHAAHTELTTDHPNYWDFSFGEMIEFDLPAMLEYVIAHSKYSTTGLVGHSQGAMVSIATLTNPRYGAMVNSLALLNSASNFDHSDEVTIPWSAVSYAASVCQSWPNFPLCGSFQPFEFIRRCIFTPVCRRIPWFCFSRLCNVAGCHSHTNWQEDEGAYFQYYPTEVSLKNLGHFAQCELAGQFQQFDHGPQGNLAKYGSVNPPAYEIKLTVPTTIMYGTGDHLMPSSRSRGLVEKLAGPHVFEVHELAGLGHADLLIGVKKMEIAYPALLKLFHTFKPLTNVHEASPTPTTTPSAPTNPTNPTTPTNPTIGSEPESSTEEKVVLQ